MATKSENSEIAVLQQQMEDMNKTVARIESTLDGLDTKLDSFAQSYVPLTVFEEFKKRRWAENTLSAIAGAVLMSVIASLVYVIFGR